MRIHNSANPADTLVLFGSRGSVLPAKSGFHCADIMELGS